jgi:hypothetical protein
VSAKHFGSCPRLEACSLAFIAVARKSARCISWSMLQSILLSAYVDSRYLLNHQVLSTELIGNPHFSSGNSPAAFWDAGCKLAALISPVRGMQATLQEARRVRAGPDQQAAFRFASTQRFPTHILWSPEDYPAARLQSLSASCYTCCTAHSPCRMSASCSADCRPKPRAAHRFAHLGTSSQVILPAPSPELLRASSIFEPSSRKLLAHRTAQRGPPAALSKSLAPTFKLPSVHFGGQFPHSPAPPPCRKPAGCSL